MAIGGPPAIRQHRATGNTESKNLLPLCSHLHYKVHDNGWQLTLGPIRLLGIKIPDGTIRVVKS